MSLKCHKKHKKTPNNQSCQGGALTNWATCLHSGGGQYQTRKL